MHLPGIFPLLIVALLVLVLFGRGRISEMMGDFGKGIKSFKEGIRDEPEAPRIDAAPKVITPDVTKSADTVDRP